MRANETEAGALRALAVDMAKEAGGIILRTAATGRATKSSPTDLVTDADRASESYLFDRIRKERPGDSLIAEEGSSHEGTTGIEWVVDPLDGTINFVYGIPQWSVSIGVEGRVRLGVVHDPVRDETFTDAGEFHPSAEVDLAGALIGTGFSYEAEVRARQAEVLRQVLPNVRDIRRAGSCALDLAWVACGKLDGFYEERPSRWDTSAGVALIEAAGGAVRAHGSLFIAAGNETLLDKLEALVLEPDR